MVAPVDHRFPLEADETRTTISPAHWVEGPTVVINGVGGIGLTVITKTALVTVAGLEQLRSEVITQVIVALFGSVVEVKVELLLPTFTPFTFHWNAGTGPPFPGVAVKLSICPAQEGFGPALCVIVMEGTRTELTVMVIGALVPVDTLAQGARGDQASHNVTV